MLNGQGLNSLLWVLAGADNGTVINFRIQEQSNIKPLVIQSICAKRNLFYEYGKILCHTLSDNSPFPFMVTFFPLQMAAREGRLPQLVIFSPSMADGILHLA